MANTLSRGVLLALFVSAVSHPSAADEIHDAARAGDATAVESLLAQDPKIVDTRDDDGNTPLIVASAQGHTEVVQRLLSSGAGVAAADSMGQTSLHRAAEGGHPEVARLLIEGGAPSDVKNARGRTPLFMAASRSGNAEICRMLIERGADIDTRDMNDTSALVAATAGGFGDVVDLLLEKGAKLPTERNEIRSLLGIATETGNKRVFDLMVSKGAVIEINNDGGGELLRAAASSGATGIAEYLILGGVDPDWQNIYGLAPIHLAARAGRLEFVKMLLGKGAELDLRSISGKSAYNMARERGHEDIVDLLVARGANQDPPRFPELKGPYLGEEPPGDEPKRFAVGIVSDFWLEHSPPAFSKDLMEIHWGVGFPATIFTMRVEEGQWTPPAPVPFTFEGGDDAPFFSRDGTKLFFLSFRPLSAGGPADKENIWFVERRGSGWTEPRPISQAVNSFPLHWEFSLGPDDALYFSSTRNVYGSRDLYKSTLADGEYSEPRALEPPVNSEYMEHMPFIAAGGTYLLFVSRDRPDGAGDFDIYVSFKEKDGGWQAPQNLGAPVNTEGTELCPVVTPDGKYLFFFRNFDIFWVRSDVIERLRAGEPEP